MARQKTARVKDKWREKKWVTVLAPPAFNNVPIAYVPITDDQSAVGRVVEVTLFDIVKGDPSQHQFKLYFQVNKVEGETATSIFKRYEYAKEFLRSLVRRGSSLINFIADFKTKDGYLFRIKIIALTQKKLNTSRKHALRLIAKDVMVKTIPEMTIDQFIQATAFGKINSDILAAVKKVIHVRHVGIEKAKLIRTAEAEIALLQAK
ncbi:MAG: 30S ribosomal protein S3ae [Thaumarchaeota archaeon 13_1_40CM_38_12]|nr:MAG: 30S ribosomal protein S3ae [Thaumarchaeota archaeon 13_1_40CM_38_12]OLC36656.1 MAG: 30S ribosomal protein S3ae [Thaumarchaeota archaeon 13_1_40CM_4_38_7]OLC91756.1 MAG: 30S ribosomal protein S3ae [Thaumarchaeota archaeon 13_1_40CM_3_38_6]OLD40555.1 MAG: 30S ribosomal protein S3ae [Thaumarchaeota archaeon 13_1_40CM_2_39_4]TLY03451.1 MAG: 30S ribosomal protein S3ae [Nitrososphaerota archaeon]